MENIVGAGVGIMVLKDNKILLGKRHDNPEKASSELHGEGTWTMPGGKMHFHEEFEDAAKRELIEETGIIPKSLKIISLTNDKVPDKHFITIGFLCDSFEGEPKTLEPDEITEWKWFKLTNLPEKVFSPCKKILRNYLDKEIYKH